MSLNITDDRSLSTNVAKIVTDLASSGLVDFLTAPYSTDLTKAAAPIADKYKKVMLSAGSATRSTFSNQRYLFGALSPADDSLLPVLTALQAQGARTVGYFYEAQTYTKTVCSAIPGLISSNSLQLEITVGGIQVPADPDSAAIATALNQFNSTPDIFIGCVYYDGCMTTLQQMATRRMIPGAKVFTLCATDPQFSSQAGANGLYVLTGME